MTAILGMILMYDAFVSYASEDVQKVTELNRSLRARGLKTWFDKDDLKPGKWYPQIERAISNARSIVVCLSDAAIDKLRSGRGVQDNEISSAYYLAQALPPSQFTILPVRLEDCARGDMRDNKEKFRTRSARLGRQTKFSENNEAARAGLSQASREQGASRKQAKVRLQEEPPATKHAGNTKTS